ncbi:right-handed parallel beta-helix repeat-containing protein [Mucilaginibacter polytrichastri]|nr:right-handed parallel beta-helix repeat-containing protein [Mucilaginibacter polytrichastri]
MSLCGYATNYYVSEKSNNNKPNGLSTAKAFKNIQDAAHLTKPGDTVFVMNGNYTNACPACNVFDVTKSGSKSKYIVFINYPNQHPKLNFNGWAGIAINSGVSYVKVVGFEVTGNNAKVTLAKALVQPQSCANKKGTFDPQYNGNGITINGLGKKHAHHIVIANNIVHDCGGGGIGASHADYITISGNTVYNTSWYTVFGTSGIALYQFWNYDNSSGYHNVISGNKCYNNKSLVPWIKQCIVTDGNGIIIDDFRSKQNGSKLGDYNGRTLIENNICWYNGGTGIHTFQSDHIDIINNTAYCNSQTKELNAGQILSGLGNDNRIINNILVSDSENVINSNYTNTNLTYENNLHYNITYPDKAIIAVSSATCLNNVNPSFVYPANNLKADFRIQKGSPAIHRGNTVVYSTSDYEGNKRAQGHTADIGAYEN